MSMTSDVTGPYLAEGDPRMSCPGPIETLRKLKTRLHGNPIKDGEMPVDPQDLVS